MSANGKIAPAPSPQPVPQPMQPGDMNGQQRDDFNKANPQARPPQPYPQNGYQGTNGGRGEQMSGPMQMEYFRSAQTMQAPQNQGAPQGVQAPPLQATPQQPTTPDPFTAMGGGTFVNGGWIPNSNPQEIARQRALGGGQPGQPAQPGAPGAPQGQPGSNVAGAPTRGAGAALSPMDLGKDPFSTYQGSQFTGATPDAYQADKLNQNPYATYQGAQFDVNSPDAYKADQFSQFRGPDQSGIEGQQNALMQSILRNPNSMSDQHVGILQEQQKEQALSMADQLRSRVAQGAASRGVSGGGWDNQQNAAIDQNLMSSILGSNQNVALQKMQQDRADQLNALGASNDMLSGQMGRASQGFQNTLAGQSAQAGANQVANQSGFQKAGFDLTKQTAQADQGHKAYQSQFDAQNAGTQREIAQAGINQAAAQSGFQRNAQDLQRQGMQSDENFRGFQSRANAEQNALQRSIAQFGVNQGAANFNEGQYGTDLSAFMQGRGQDIQKHLGDAGIAMDGRRLSEQGRQFDKGFGLDVAKFGEGQRQFNNQMGFNYNQLDQQGQLSMMDWLRRGGGF